MNDECVCGHLESKHEFRSHIGGCLMSNCFCVEFENADLDDDRWLPGDDH